MTTPKSKESRKKVRRWGFTVNLTNKEGQSASNTTPNMIIGTTVDAQQGAEELKQELLKTYHEFEIKVTPVGYETLSDYMVKAVSRSSRHIEILDKAIEMLCEDWATKPAPESIDPKDLSALYVKRAVEFFYPPIEPKIELTDADEVGANG